ncbi:MAG: lamin tail domain-containing protein, partial [Kiritimatiellae bacterium]|nr:lamin tail domain-containing protein [Kiritimatiellia bacterium]
MINELHVDPDPKTSFVEFIEVHNTGAAAVDLTGWSFSDGVQYTFPSGAVLPAGGFAVVAGNPASVEALFGITGVYGAWTGTLANEGETLILRDASGDKVDEVTYQIGFPWPTVGDAPSYSMELLHPDIDNDLGGHWRSSVGSAVIDGTPLPAGASGWKYFKGTAEPSSPRALWRQSGFDDSSWTAATLPIGYGEQGIATTLSDMQNKYTSVYLRRTFEIANAALVTQLQALIRYDDGFNLWINGVHVLSNNVGGEDLANTAVAIENRNDNNTIKFPLPDPAGYLHSGTNVIAVQLLNQRKESGDAYFNIELDSSAGAEPGPTPGESNSVYPQLIPPAVRQVKHQPKQPAAGEPVTISAKATAESGVASMTLEYQIVEPGAYIRLTDAAYSNQTNWISMPMLDNGTGGDAVAGDDTFTAQIPASVQTHRRLVRYRMRTIGVNGAKARAPLPDDPVPNFAYFVYNGVPAWQGALRPGYTETLTFPSDTLTNIPVYHLIAVNSDVISCQYNTAYNDDVYRWLGTFVCDGEVFDHIRYRIRGSASTYSTGKNKWKIKFPTGHEFEALNEHGESYGYPWENITFSALMCPWWGNDVSTAGTILNETAGMDLYRLAGVPAIRSHFFHYRIIDDAVEASASSQYEGDFWGLYLAIEETEADYIKANGLPDGNIYNVNGSVAASVKRNQGPTSALDFSDLSAEMSFTTGHHKPSPYQPYDYWTSNIALDNYYRFNTINLLVNNTDMYLSGGKIERNLVYYRNPETGLWWTLPWDLDLTFESAPHLSFPDTSWEHFWYVLTYAEARRDYENVVREISDLLIRNGDATKVIEAAAARVCRFESGMPVELNGWPQANQAMWDYHPRANKKGIFYKNMGSSVTNFVTFFNYMKNYVTSAGYGGGRVEAKLTLTGVPNTPTVSYLGESGYPTDDLRFQVSAFSDTDGGAFAALQWRIAEITPTSAPDYPAVEGGIRYEIHPTWTEESGAYTPEIQIPYEVAQLGRTYRVRARMKDDAGHWSRWSAPVEFTPSAPTSFDPASASNLQLTEIHYNPLDDLPLDFIEMRNISGGPINLAGAQFNAGVTFTFGSWTLQP